MSEETKVEVVDPEDAATELVVVDATMATMWDAAEGAIFVPNLRKDMPLVERKASIRSILETTKQVDDRLNLVQGEMLYEVSRNSYWKDWEFVDEEGETRKYANFEEYLNDELDMQRRKAFYLIGIYNKFVIELNLPAEVLKDLQWSKAKEVTGIINAENWKDVLAKMRTLSVRKLKEWVKELRTPTPAPGEAGAEGEGTDGTGTTADSEPEVTERLTFKFTADQLANVKEALSVAESMGCGEKPGNQLDMMATVFKTSAVSLDVEGALQTLDVIVKNVERTFGVEMSVTEVDPERYKELGEGDTEEA